MMHEAHSANVHLGVEMHRPCKSFRQRRGISPAISDARCARARLSAFRAITRVISREKVAREELSFLFANGNDKSPFSPSRHFPPAFYP